MTLKEGEEYKVVRVLDEQLPAARQQSGAPSALLLGAPPGPNADADLEPT